MWNRPTYFDHQATTPVDRRVLEAMLPYFTELFGNPHSEENAYGQVAADAVTTARGQVADLIGAKPREIVFTSGATEANNIAVLGVARRLRPAGKNHLITCQTEHKSVLAAASALEREGFEVTRLPVDSNGRLPLADLTAALRPETALVSVMTANNEIGVLQPIAEIGGLCRAAGVAFHTDAAQAAGKIPLKVADLAVDFLSLSSHKLYGPKGVGALYVRHDPRLRPEPLMFGGGQEGGLRPGTLPAPLCVGFGSACALSDETMSQEQDRLAVYRTHLLERLAAAGVDFEINGTMDHRLAGNLNVSFKGVDAEALLMTLRGDVALASGSACTAASLEPSYVVTALGFGIERAESAIRIGIGRFTTLEEVEGAGAAIAAAVTRLARLSYRPAALAREN